MAATRNCDACSDLQENSADFVQNGVTDAVCTSLKNDTGFNPSSDNDDCTDLNNANDCLIGNMEDEIDSYDMCDWKEYMRNFVHNLWNVLKAMICAMCGIWTNIHKHDCEISYLYNGASFTFGEDTEGVASKIVPGKGVDFSLRHQGQQHSTDVTITYVAGGLAKISGSLKTFTESFVDGNGQTRAGNTAWDFSASNYDLPSGGELLYEVRIKKSEYPQINRFFGGDAWNTGGGQAFFHANVIRFNGDNPPEGQTVRYAYGQHGWCDDDGSPSAEGYSSGHAVPKGWEYIQVRLLYQQMKTHNIADGSGTTKRGTNFSPSGDIGIRMARDEVEC